MKRCTNFLMGTLSSLVGAMGFLVSAMGLATAAKSQEYGGDDPRFEWKCVYPYSETNCERIIKRWSSDHNVSVESIMAGMACSNCDIHYFADQFGQHRPLFAKCLQRVGTRLVQHDTLDPIVKYKEGESSVPGWEVQDWFFTTCFDAWECCDFCAMDKNPPHCLIYQEAGWGIHVPVQGAACTFGSAPSVPSQPSTTQPSTTQSGTTQPTTTQPSTTQSGTTQPSTTQPATSSGTQTPSSNFHWFPLN